MDKNLAKNEKTLTILSTKQKVRKEILKRIGRADWASISGQINQRLEELLVPSPLVIAGFSQHKSEPDIFPFLHFWHQKGGTCCLPVIAAPNQPLIFRSWDFEKPLVKGVHDILMPSETEAEVIPNIILTPLIAFDQRGSRLGRCGGYYDRTLKVLRSGEQKPFVIGVAAHQQYVEHLPIESHDESLDMVVTDKEIIRFKV